MELTDKRMLNKILHTNANYKIPTYLHNLFYLNFHILSVNMEIFPYSK